MMTVFLDRRVPLTSGTYAAGSTTWVLPYAVKLDGTEGEVVVARQDTGEILPGGRASETSVYSTGDFHTTPVFVGILYDFRYVPTRIFYRDQEGNPETRGRLQLRYLDVSLADTTSLTVDITPAGRPTSSTTFTRTSPADETLRVPVQTENKQATIVFRDRSAGAVTLTGIDWEGYLTMRAQRR